MKFKSVHQPITFQQLMRWCLPVHNFRYAPQHVSPHFLTIEIQTIPSTTSRHVDSGPHCPLSVSLSTLFVLLRENSGRRKAEDPVCLELGCGVRSLSKRCCDCFCVAEATHLWISVMVGRILEREAEFGCGVKIYCGFFSYVWLERRRGKPSFFSTFF